LRPLTVAIFMVGAITCAAFGQITLKYGMQKYGSLGAPGLNLVPKVLGAVFTLHVLLGLCLCAISACFWLVVISPSGWALSYAYPMIGISYVGVVLLSRAIFREAVMPLQWLGTALMCVGLILIARFGASTGGPP
jgi:multidrug transporter EmrE-like cation transporter